MGNYTPEVGALIKAGSMLANCAFNLEQIERLTLRERRSLDESRKAWDEAHSAYAATLSQQAGRVGPKWDAIDEQIKAIAPEDFHIVPASEYAALTAALAQNMQAQHPDDASVDRFAAALKAKLAEARAKGRGGWNGDEPGMQQRLSDMLRDHVAKGDPRDVGNFAMFLHQRGESILPAQSAQGEAVAYFSADPAEGDFSTHNTLEAAIADAEKMLGYAQDAATEEGWPDEPPQICYGVVLGKCVEKEGSRQPAPEGSDFEYLVDYHLTGPRTAELARVPEFQAGVSEWMSQCFLPSLYSNMTERGDRLLEEVLELLQSTGYDRSRVATLVDYVWGRPEGEPAQEVGGVMVTLAGFCWIAGLNMHEAGDTELARINQPEAMEKIRRKQQAKNALHFDTPLPGSAAAPSPRAEVK